MPEMVPSYRLSRGRGHARAVENSLWVIRADVAGRTRALTSHGSSGIVDPDGMVVASAPMSEVLLVTETGFIPSGRLLKKSTT